MSSDKNKFSFDLNESLYLEKGQEVAEMMQISLDPEISIQPYNDYISIRGAIQLQGAYRKAETNEEAEEDWGVSNNQRFMEQVTDMREGEASFSHSFPVEISVPTYRVEDFNEITVSVESFDYEIPNQNQLKLNSTIDIHGIVMEDSEPHYTETTQEEETEPEELGGREFQPPQYTPPFIDEDAQENKQNAEERESEQESEAPLSDTAELETESLSAAFQPELEQVDEPTEQDSLQQIPNTSSAAQVDGEMKQEEAVSPLAEESRDSEVQAEQVNIQDFPESEEANHFQFDIKETEKAEETAKTEQPVEDETDEYIEKTASPGEEESNLAEEEEEKGRWKKKSQTLAEFFNSNPSPANENVETQADEVAWVDPSPSSSHIDYEVSSSSYESMESSSEAITDVRYLADMFRKEDEEQYAQLRLCIVQHKDTIETVAERYQVPTLQILKQNQLDGDNLAEGQLLYIPAKRKKNE